MPLDFPNAPTSGQTFTAPTGMAYIFMNGVWQANTAASPVTRRSESIIIAASDTTNPSGADYICTGSGDDAVITAAINSLRGTGGTVKLRSGTFRLAAPIVHDADWVSLVGESRGFWKQYNGAYPALADEGMPGGTKIKQLTAGADGIQIGTSFQAEGRHRGISIKDLYLYGATGGRAIYDAGHTDISEVTDCVFHNWADAINISWDTPFISGNSIQSCSGNGIALNFVFGTIVKNIIYDIGGSGVVLGGSGGVHVLGNTIGSVGYTSHTSAIVINGGSGHTINGNSVHGINGSCPALIEVIGGVLNVIVGNSLSVDNIVGYAVTANLTAHGIYLRASARNCSIGSNTINNTNASASGAAIMLGASGDTTATGNSVTGNTITGGKWSGGSATTIVDNSGGSTNKIGLNAGDAR